MINQNSPTVPSRKDSKMHCTCCWCAARISRPQPPGHLRETVSIGTTRGCILSGTEKQEQRRAKENDRQSRKVAEYRCAPTCCRFVDLIMAAILECGRIVRSRNRRGWNCTVHYGGWLGIVVRKSACATDSLIDSSEVSLCQAMF